MNNEDRERFDSVIQFLMNYCYRHGIGCLYNKDLPAKANSISYCHPSDLIVINGNWYHQIEIPFIFAHEIGHVVDGNPEYYHLAYLGKDKGEYSANIFAINLLWLYCLENDIWFETIYEFAAAFGIPNKFYYLLERTLWDE